jgi:putative transposase
MIDRRHSLFITRQARALGISRGGVYYSPRPVSKSTLTLMRRIDELHLDYPFAGSRMLQGLLLGEGYKVGRLHVRTLLKRMGVEAIYRRPNTSKPAPATRFIFICYAICRSHVPTRSGRWISPNISMARSFVYSAAVVNWFTRRVLSWRLSITLEQSFCIEAVEEALARYDKPDIFNTDQGSQFTSIDFIKILKDAKIAISMDGRSVWRDNVFMKRLWRTIKYEEIYLHAHDDVPAARAAIGKSLTFYNRKRPHSSLDR